MDSGKVFLGVLAGLAAGAVLGVLFAPAKGSDTRRKISNKSEELVDDLKEKFNEFLEGIKDKMEHVKEDLTDFAENTKSKVEEAQKQTKTV